MNKGYGKRLKVKYGNTYFTFGVKSKIWKSTAEKAVATLKKITDLKATIEKERILLMGKRSKQGLEFFHQLFKNPVVTSQDVQRMTGLSPKAANDLIRAFIEQKILLETTGYQRNRVFVFDEYVRMF